MQISDIEVTYVDHMGSDLSIVNAARVSFDKESDWEYVDSEIAELKGEVQCKRLSLKDKKLIKYLADHDHISPFHHTFITLRVKAPIFVARQLVKHEYMPWNEVSRRYVDSEPEFYFPKYWRARAEDKKQGSGGEHPCSDFWERCSEELVERLLISYLEAIENGVCPEQARMFLPQNMMTEWYWSGTLSAYAKMLGLRLLPDTQEETRIVAEKVKEEVTSLFPVSLTSLLPFYLRSHNEV